MLVASKPVIEVVPFDREHRVALHLCVVDQPVQVARRVGVGERLVEGDDVLVVEPVQRLLEGLRALGERLLHRLLDRVELAALDQLGDVAGVHEDLDRRDALAVGLAHQALGDHAAQRHREVEVEQLAVFEREEVDDAVERVVGVVGMQRRQAQVAGLRVGDRRLHGLAVADLADQDAVGRLAHGVAQGLAPAQGVDAHLALVHHRLAVLEEVLDRVLDGEDVTAAVAVAVVDHGRERG